MARLANDRFAPTSGRSSTVRAKCGDWIRSLRQPGGEQRVLQGEAEGLGAALLNPLYAFPCPGLRLYEFLITSERTSALHHVTRVRWLIWSPQISRR